MNPLAANLAGEGLWVQSGLLIERTAEFDLAVVLAH